jgi:NAD(P)H dehydrogenase (quinone)
LTERPKYIFMKEKVLITGSTGATGTDAVKCLLESNIDVRALVRRRDSRSEQLAQSGAELVQGDLLDFNSVSTALKGISRAYFVYDIKVPGILEATNYFSQAAIEEGVTHIVNMSQISARREAVSHAAQNHWISEKILDNTGIAVTHLRPTYFAEWLMYLAAEIRGHNRIVMPFADVRYAPIAGEDIGRVISAILANPKDHEGKAYSIYGQVEVTQYEIAEILSRQLGRTITYVPVSIAAFADILRPNFTPYFVQHISGVAQDCLDGIFSGMNDLVEKISGRPPLTIGDYIRKNIELLR